MVCILYIYIYIFVDIYNNIFYVIFLIYINNKYKFIIDSKIKTKSNTSTKSLDLEKWLDSILDD